MKVICAPDKFKGSLSAVEAARCMAAGVRQARPDAVVDLCPVADGGEGTVEAVLASAAGRAESRHSTVTGPLGRPVSAAWALLAEEPRPVAVMEMAAASGLALVPVDQRDPCRTTTLGTGQLLLAALEAGCCRVLLGIGGSATTDGGAGCAQALGIRFLDADGRPIRPPLSGGDLHRIRRIDADHRDRRLAGVEITAACDVRNPLTGPDGAACIYAPQKGADAAAVDRLDQALRHLAELIRRDLGVDIEHLPGAGAAGGLGGGLVAFLGARLRSGIELVLEAVRFDDRLRGADLCLTGEGRLDGQTASGKAVLGVAQAAARLGVPTLALVGSAAVDAAQAREAGLPEFRLIAPGRPIAESMARAGEFLTRAAAEAVAGRCGQGDASSAQ